MAGIDGCALHAFGPNGGIKEALLLPANALERERHRLRD